MKTRHICGVNIRKIVLYRGMTYEQFKAVVAKNLRQMRKSAGLTQEEMAGLEMNVRSYQKLEYGKTSISLKSIYIISKRLKIHPGKLFPPNF